MRATIKKAIGNGDCDTLRRLLNEDPSLAQEPIEWGGLINKCRSEPLHYLSDGPFHGLWNHGKQAEMARIFLEAGAPVNGLPESGETPLHGAASLDRADVAEVLIEFGADLEVRAEYPGIRFGTPLEFAIFFGMREVADLLYRHGARIYSSGMAAGVGDIELLESMLPAENPPTDSDILRAAAVGGRTEVVQYLLDRGLDINLPVSDATALHWAAWEYKPAMVEFLLGQGADRNILDTNYKLTPLGWANHRAKNNSDSPELEKIIAILGG